MKEKQVKRKTTTINNIEKALMDLLKEKPLYEIRVREICEAARVNHSTFYLHYYDAFDLYDDIKACAIKELNDIIATAFSPDCKC